jgi:N-acetylmuramoyl-L-alanine amidase
VKKMRLARQPAGLRIVLDLARPAQAKSFLAAPNSRYGYRLVIDLGVNQNDTPGVATAGVVTPVKAEHAPPDARDLVIAIDAGHGGEDPGAIGKNGTREKDVVLAIARELALKINAEPGMKAVLTRNGDYFVPLRDRMRRARAQKADLFVSIHADSIRDRRIDGSSVYILSQRGATDEASRWLAERENASDLIGGVSLDDKDDVLASVLLDLSQSASLSASQTAAERVLRQLNRVGEVRKPQVQQARFMVLKSPDIASMLVETAYISNPQEELRLRAHSHQAKLAAAIHQGVHDYFYANPPAGTRVAQLATAAAAPRPVLATSGGSGE